MGCQRNRVIGVLGKLRAIDSFGFHRELDITLGEVANDCHRERRSNAIVSVLDDGDCWVRCIQGVGARIQHFTHDFHLWRCGGIKLWHRQEHALGQSSEVLPRSKAGMKSRRRP